MNTKFILGIVVGAALALGGTWAYKSYCSACWSEADSANQQAQIGKPAPDFTLMNQYGQEVALSQVNQKGPIVLEWFNKDCPYVKKFYDAGEMQRLQNAYGGQGFQWLRIVSSAPGKQGHLNREQAKASHKKSKADHTLMDPTGEVGRSYGAKTTPHVFVIDEDGMLVYAGAVDSIRSTDSADIKKAESYLVAALEAVQNDTPLETSSTEPYGCSVKY